MFCFTFRIFTYALMITLLSSFSDHKYLFREWRNLGFLKYYANDVQRNDFVLRTSTRSIEISGGRAVGIDLGTTNSVVSVIEGGLPVVISVNGSRIVPSIVTYLSPQHIIIGEHARRQFAVHPLSTYASVKRVIGQTNKQLKMLYNKDRLKNLHVNYADDENSLCRLNGPDWIDENLKMNADDKTSALNSPRNRIKKEISYVTPEEISAQVLRTLVEAAQSYLKEPVNKAVVTVPAYFLPSQCEATERAAILAGLQKVKLLREPEAAALAYGLREKEQQLVLVFDLGGGTFDVSVLEVGGGFVEVIATSGDRNLGGNDMDAFIADWLKKQFINQNINTSHSDGWKDSKRYSYDQEGNDNIILSKLPNNDPWMEARLLEAAEKARILLSTAQETEIYLPFLYKNFHLRCTLTRTKLESLCRPLLPRILRPMREVALMAGINLPGDSGQIGYTNEVFTGKDVSDIQSSVQLDQDAENMVAMLKEKQTVGREQARKQQKTRGVAMKELRRLQKSLGDAKLSSFPRGVEVNQVLLVGGVTRMPMIRKMVQIITGKEPRFTVNPDEAVSLGAAVMAGIMDGTVQGMQVLSSWQAAMYRAFYENQLESNSTSEITTNISKTSFRRNSVRRQKSLEEEMPDNDIKDVNESDYNDSQNENKALTKYESVLKKKSSLMTRIRGRNTQDIDSNR